MKKTIILSAFLIIGTIVFAQNKKTASEAKPSNSIFLNVLGDGSLVSLNYDRLFPINQKLTLSSKVGLGYNREIDFCLWNACDPPQSFLTIPYHITGNYGVEKHFLEFGLGGTVFTGMDYQPYLIYPIFGYRFIPLQSKKLNFRLFAQIPFTGLEMDGVYFLPFGASIGYSF